MNCDGVEKSYCERAMNNNPSDGSDVGKGVAPWECDPRLTRAGGRSRGLHGKAWTDGKLKYYFLSLKTLRTASR